MPMQIIEATAHVGGDGILRLEVPVAQRDRDVQVALVVESPPAPAAPGVDKWAAVRARLEAGGIHVPPPGSGRLEPFELIALPGPTASEILIRDRR